MKDVKDTYRRFKEWEQQPHQVAPLSEEQHECATCGTHYTGNYCPRCGQSYKIGRYSFKNAFLLFLDVWGLGNRGMFRSIRDLILRPGYMIRDYLRGMQMAYFPPFKMFFLLLTLTLLIDTGMNFQGENRFQLQQEQYEKTIKEAKTEQKQAEAKKGKAEEETDKTLTAEERARQQKKKKVLNMFDTEEINLITWEWYNKHVSLVCLAGLLLFSVPLYMMFRHSPAIPDLRFSECFVAMIYITNMLLIYSIVPSLLLALGSKTDEVISTLLLLLAIIPIKQFSGYSYWSTIWRLLVALIPFTIIVVLLTIVIFFTYAYIYIHY